MRLTDATDQFVEAAITSNATVLAAIIAGAVTAVTFLAAEILRLLRERWSRHQRVAEELLAAWGAVARESSPRVGRWRPMRRYTEQVDISLLCARLLATLPRADDEIVTLQMRLNDKLIASSSERERVRVAAEASARLTEWMASRRRARNRARLELADMGETATVSGRAISKGDAAMRGPFERLRDPR